MDQEPISQIPNTTVETSNHKISVDEQISHKEPLVRIINFPKVDFIISTRLQEEDVEQILKEFRNGLPENYVQYKLRGNYINSTDTPIFLVKQRWMGIHEVRRFRETGKYQNLTTRDMNAGASLLNEFHIVEKAEEILATEEAQEFARSCGYKGISLVHPLAGIITRPEGKKYMIYPFIKGGISWHKLHPELYFEDNAPVQPLRDIFEQHGIDPNDLVVKQIMIVDDKMVLLDLDQYHSIQNFVKN